MRVTQLLSWRAIMPLSKRPLQPWGSRLWFCPFCVATTDSQTNAVCCVYMSLVFNSGWILQPWDRQSGWLHSLWLWLWWIHVSSLWQGHWCLFMLAIRHQPHLQCTRNQLLLPWLWLAARGSWKLPAACCEWARDFHTKVIVCWPWIQPCLENTP